MFKIDHDIPIPTRRASGSTDFLKTLEIGQSFLIDKKTRNALHPIAKRIGIKLITKKDGDLIRVWRTA